MRLRKTPGERLRSERLRTLPPLALEFSRIMGEVFGESAKARDATELKAMRLEAAVLATRILDDMEHLRWDQGVTPEMRQILEATRRKMLTDKRIKGLLTEAKTAAASP
jgi:hypothetical protein